MLGAAGVALLLAAGGGVWIAVRDDAPPVASCPAVLEYEHRTYEAHGEMLRRPRPGQVLGTGVVPGCADEKGSSIEVAELPGVDPSVAVLSDGRVWLAASAGPPPPDVDELDQLVACHLDGTRRVSGDWVAVRGPMPTRDDELTPPYVAVIEADEGEGLPLDRWSAVTIEVQVTAETVGGDDDRIADRSLRGPEQVSLNVRCDAGAWVAESMAADR